MINKSRRIRLLTIGRVFYLSLNNRRTDPQKTKTYASITWYGGAWEGLVFLSNCVYKAS